MSQATSFWNSPAGASKTAEVEKLLYYVSFGIFSYDTILNAAFDWSIISGKRQRRWPQLLYFGTKLAFLVYLGLFMALFWLEKKMNCQGAVTAAETFMGFIAIMSSSLLACRTVCVYSGRVKQIVVTTLLFFGAGLTVAWMYGVNDVTAIWYPAAASPWNQGACAPIAVKSTYWVKYLMNIIFDLVVLILTVIGIKRMNSSSRLGDIIIKQGVIYFILTLVVNIIITVLTILKLSTTMSLLAAAPQSCILVVASTRLYRELAEEASANGHVSSNQNSMNNQSPPYHSSGGEDSSHQSLPSTSSQRYLSSDDVEKTTLDSSANLHGSPKMIRVQQTEVVVDSTPSPDYLHDHPFSNSSFINYERANSNNDRHTTQDTQARYPKLLGQNAIRRDYKR